MLIAILGKRDSPTDAVEDYCRLLAEALSARGVESALERVQWAERGWPGALKDLWQKSANWKGDWALVQYTALMWSRRGFPLSFLLVLGVLGIRGARVAVVFHDAQPYEGKRLRDRVRQACQRMVMRRAYTWSDVSILNVPLQCASWLPRQGAKGTYIPIGSNLPAIATPRRTARNGEEAKTITVFAVTAANITREVADIARVAMRAAERLPRVRLVTVGRGSDESESRFRQALRGSPVEYHAFGILPAEQVSRILANSDVALFVRGLISTQRGSAIASVANGVPLVGYADPCLLGPLAEAGVVGVRYLDGEKLAEETIRVLTDPVLWRDLHGRSQRAFDKHFSWQAVADRFLDVLRNAD